MQYVPRSEWGARPPKSVRPIAGSDALFVHHAVTDDGDEDYSYHEDEHTILREIQRYHMDTKGWKDVAYSWLVGQSGRIYEGRGWGVAGGHTDGHNNTSHAVCFIGNSDIHEPTAAALGAIAAVRAEHHRRYGTDRLRSHRDVNSTGCPGGHLAAWVTNPTQPTPNPEEFTVDKAAADEFHELRKRLDEHVLPAIADLKAWQLNTYAEVLKVKAVDLEALADDVLAELQSSVDDLKTALADELARRMAS